MYWHRCWLHPRGISREEVAKKRHRRTFTEYAQPFREKKNYHITVVFRNVRFCLIFYNNVVFFHFILKGLRSAPSLALSDFGPMCFIYFFPSLVRTCQFIPSFFAVGSLLAHMSPNGKCEYICIIP